MPEEPLFAPQAAAVTGELGTGAAACAVAADDAVAGHDDCHRIASVGRAHGAHGFGVVDGVGNRLIAGGFAVRDAEKLLPDLSLTGRAVQGEGQIEAAQFASEIRGQLPLRLPQKWMRARPRRVVELHGVVRTGHGGDLRRSARLPIDWLRPDRWVNSPATVEREIETAHRFCRGADKASRREFSGISNRSSLPWAWGMRAEFSLA